VIHFNLKGSVWEAMVVELRCCCCKILWIVLWTHYWTVVSKCVKWRIVCSERECVCRIYVRLVLDCCCSLFETGTIVLLESVVSESVITITSISRSRSRARTLFCIIGHCEYGREFGLWVMRRFSLFHKPALVLEIMIVSHDRGPALCLLLDVRCWMTGC
jgi:hypothetical protein